MNLWSPYPQNSEPNNTGYKKCVICYLKENQLSILRVLAQWYSLHLRPLGPQKGYGIQTHWCAGESAASNDLDLCVPMACQVASALVHKRDRETERESCKHIGSGRKSSRNPLILGSFPIQRNWNFLV
jgi:hypothetical protein